MELGAIFLILAVLILTGAFVSRPLLIRESPSAQNAASGDATSEHERSTLMAERDRILTALQELDFDNQLGKIPEAEYPTQRSALLLQGADVLRKLDGLNALPAAGSAEERLESAIAARRADGVPPVPQPETSTVAVIDPLADDELERMISSRRQARPERAAGFCPACGRPIQVSDKFCPKCGARL